MNKGIQFAFGIHNHQPLGNFDGTFEEAYSNSYLPFLKIVEKYPQIRLALHMPGILWEWTERRHPEFLDIVGRLLDNDQIELMTGGYYEPILPMIPDSDKIGQIVKLSDYLRRRFSVDPIGMWVAERVWEPQIARAISEAGVKYVCLDDSHFKMAGLQPSQLYGYYMTEENGYKLAVYPIDMRMRYIVPFMVPEKTLEYLGSLATPFRERVVVLADDGEKFGVWPGTHKSVYEERWLERFFEMLQENADWIEMVLLRENIENHPPLGTIYLPTASYTEMMEWALPAKETTRIEDIVKELESTGREDLLRFVKGGFWRNFFSKYPESNNMHKKMLYVHRKIDALAPQQRAEATDRLWAGQCNCSYWHGVFGGLYLNHIRAAVYGNLIEAENLADDTTHNGKEFLESRTEDFYSDGTETLICSNKDMNALLHISRGGALFEWDLRQKRFNVLNTLTRREEAYHRKVIQLAELQGKAQIDTAGDTSIHNILKAKEEGLEKHLAYDWYRRSAFVDHFLGAETDLEVFRRVLYEEQGDFTLEPFRCSIEHSNGEIHATLSRLGGIFHEGTMEPVLLEKKVSFPSSGTTLKVAYSITNQADIPLSLWFGTECNFALQAGNTDDRYYIFPNGTSTKQLLGSIGEDSNLDWIGLVEEWLGIRIRWEFDKPALVWRFPIETVQNSEAGFERAYQCSCVTASWKFELHPKQTWNVGTVLKAEDISK